MSDEIVPSELLRRAADLAIAYLSSLDDRPVGGPVDLPALRTALGGPLPDGPTDPREVLDALVAGADGLDEIRAIVRNAPDFLTAGGWLLLEHGAGQEDAVRALLAAAGLEQVTTWPDLAGIARATGGKLKSD